MAEPPLKEPAKNEETGETTGQDITAISRRATGQGSDTKLQQTVLSPIDTNKDNPSADPRTMRRIIAEDPEWSLATVPHLSELCIKHIVVNFENNSDIINRLLLKHQKMVLEKISVDLPLKVTALLVEDEGYWNRCCKARWAICDVSAYGKSWKRMFFERNIQEIIEHFVPESTDPAKLNDIIPLSSCFIKRLVIKQLLPPVREAPKSSEFDDESDTGSEAGDESACDHFDFGPLFSRLPNLEEFHVMYGVRDCGMNFEWNLFQFTARDCLQLAQSVAACKHLKIFKLQQSKVDDEKVRVLVTHILDHPGITELDLSHNLIGDRGARAIGKLINNHSQIVKLNLCDNHIRIMGAQAIAHALTKNTILTHMNLRLNRLGDEGGQAICRALLKNRTLTHINLSSNDMAEPSAAILSQVVMQNSTLQYLDLSCNRLGADGGKQLQEGIDENTTIQEMDLRLTECGQESEYCINQILHRNQEAKRQVKLKEMESAGIIHKKLAEPQASHRYKITARTLIQA